ncbi:MAG TPA: lipid II flippase MurJ [Solirubrobacteraceae bacterium]|nr:lipid II flippase MurJ [Solirubrobacteraceae bacterium]
MARFTPRNVSRLLQRPTGRALIGTLVGNIPGFLLPFAIVARMHAGQLTDAYSFALGIAMFTSALFVTVLQMNVLPILQRMKRLGRMAFLGRIRRIAIHATGAAALSYGALGAGAIIYIDGQSHWTEQQHRLLLVTMAVLAIFVLASAVNSVLSAGLNALDSFLSPAASQALKSILPLAAVGFVSPRPDGLIVIAALVAGGELVRTCVLIPQLRHASLSLSPAPAPPGYASYLSLWRVAAPSGVALLISGASPLIDRGVAASLRPGSVTLIDLGEKVLQVPVTIISTSLVLVAGTHWANMLTSDIPALRRSFRQTLIRGGVVCAWLLLAMTVALGVIGAFAGNTLVGAPTGRLLAIVALLLAGLPGAFLITAGARLLTATRSSYLLPGFGLCAFVTNLVFDIAGARAFGVEGIALSSTLYRYVNGALFLIVIQRLMKTGFNGLDLPGPFRGRSRLAKSATIRTFSRVARSDASAKVTRTS